MKVFSVVFAFVFLVASQGFARDWQEIVESGTLKVGVRTAAQFVYRPASEEKPGFTYEMVQEFAEQHGLALDLIEISSFSTYWKGETGTPPIYDEIDLAAEIFTVTPQRQKRVELTPFLDSIEIFFAAKGSEIKNYDDLKGKTILTYEAMSFYPLVKAQFDARNLPYQETFVTPTGDELGSFTTPESFAKTPDKINLMVFPKGTKAKATMSYLPVANKNIDVGINDAVGVLYRVFEVGHFKDRLRPLFPANTKRSQLAWGSAADSVMLNEKIRAFFSADRASGNFSKRLEKYIGMSEADYMTLISMFE
ncbi:MAG: transporter substrate-binding domain-containing protein [Magnetovibrionaceae bacterium]